MTEELKYYTVMHSEDKNIFEFDNALDIPYLFEHGDFHDSPLSIDHGFESAKFFSFMIENLEDHSRGA